MGKEPYRDWHSSYGVHFSSAMMREDNVSIALVYLEMAEGHTSDKVSFLSRRAITSETVGFTDLCSGVVLVCVNKKMGMT